ncbi:unnamed protein product, partial [Ectocarpus sp. 6 AP-2014]
MGDGGSFSDAGGEGNFAGGGGSSSGGGGSHACRDASVSSDCGSEKCGSEGGGDLKGMAFLPPSPMDRNSPGGGPGLSSAAWDSPSPRRNNG